MAHFTLEKWADFARNTLKEKDKAAMQGHLETGCKSCADRLKLWTHVCDLTSRESAYRPPADAVRAAEGMFGIHDSRRKASILALLFDSLLAPSIAGVRSTATLARQLLYAAGAYRIDLRMEPKADTDSRVSVLGQILNSADPTRMVEPMPITLVQNRKVVSSSRTGTFGEFELECELADRLQLKLRLPDGVGVEIPLLEPSKAALTGELESPDSKDISSKRVSRRQGTRRKV